MTTYGIDGSHYQPGLSMAAVEAQGAAFVAARSSRGAGYVDTEFRDHLNGSKTQEMLFSGYHFLYATRFASIGAQADTVEEALGSDKKIPIWIDCEHSKYGGSPTLPEAANLRDILEGRGVEVAGIYLPKWYWLQVGSPKLAGWKALWSSRYVKGYTKGSIKSLYPGDGHVDLWESYGGMTPTIAQYTSSSVIPGYTANTVDANAFRGSLTELRALKLFKDYAPAEAPARPNAQAVLDAAKKGVAGTKGSRRERFQSILDIAETLV